MHVTDRPIVPDVLPRVQAYCRQHRGGGVLHVVLEDMNLEDVFVRYAIDFAREEGDTEGAELAGLLLQMTRSQRGRIAKQAFR